MLIVDTVFITLLVVFILCTFVAAYFYVKSAGHWNAPDAPDRKKTMSALKTVNFNRQKYVAEKISIYGVCNMGTSLDERKIYKCSYSRMGL